MTDSMTAMLRLARLIDATVKLDKAPPGGLGDALDVWLDALAAVTGEPRERLDGMEPERVRALMDRVIFGDAYGDAADTVREAWAKLDNGGDPC